MLSMHIYTTCRCSILLTSVTYIYLCINLACPYERVSRKPESGASGLSDLAWDGAEVYTASGSTMMAYDDAFTLMQAC